MLDGLNAEADELKVGVTSLNDTLLRVVSADFSGVLVDFSTLLSEVSVDEPAVNPGAVTVLGLITKVVVVDVEDSSLVYDRPNFISNALLSYVLPSRMVHLPVVAQLPK